MLYAGFHSTSMGRVDVVTVICYLGQALCKQCHHVCKHAGCGSL